MNDCKHSYVVRNIMGSHRFLCKECNDRFLQHPGLIKIKNQDTSILDQDTIAKFRAGLITFTQAIKDRGLNDKDFLKAVQIAYPPMTNMTFEEPQRTSCPKEIDDLFNDPDTTTTDINKIFDEGRFPDIVEVSHDHSIDPDDPLHDPYCTSVRVKFVDDTEQLVYLYPKGNMS